MAEARAKNEEEEEAGIKQYRKTKGIEYRKTKGNELIKQKLILFNLCCTQQERKTKIQR